jgi:hypothetical protein
LPLRYGHFRSSQDKPLAVNEKLIAFLTANQNYSDLCTDNPIEDSEVSNSKLEAGTFGGSPKWKAILTNNGGVVLFKRCSDCFLEALPFGGAELLELPRRVRRENRSTLRQEKLL